MVCVECEQMIQDEQPFLDYSLDEDVISIDGEE